MTENCSTGLRTLVLNSNYMPISIFPLQAGTIPAEDAVTRIVAGTCNIVSEYNRMIKTRNLVMKWPSVIARKDPKMVKTSVKLSTEALYYRDHGRCMYCEKPLTISVMTCDHVVPHSKGGDFSWENIVAACPKCNAEKGDALPKGRWVPRFAPVKPTYYELLNARKRFPIIIDHDSWMPFLGKWEAPITVRFNY